MCEFDFDEYLKDYTLPEYGKNDMPEENTQESLA
jgi:hypothetical protein